ALLARGGLEPRVRLDDDFDVVAHRLDEVFADGVPDGPPEDDGEREQPDVGEQRTEELHEAVTFSPSAAGAFAGGDASAWAGCATPVRRSRSGSSSTSGSTNWSSPPAATDTRPVSSLTITATASLSSEMPTPARCRVPR